jgi:hypothetical protein
MSKPKTRIEVIIDFITDAGRGYAAEQSGRNLIISHAAFSRPVRIVVGKRNADEIFITLERYRAALAKACPQE